MPDDNENEVKKSPQELKAETIKANKALQLEIVIDRLTPREKRAYDHFKKSEQKELNPAIQNELFNLFIAGKTSEEINSLNPGVTLGQIVQSRLKGEWDKRKETYLVNMLNTTQNRVQQTAVESIHFIFDMLAATHKMYGTKIKKYIQTGKEEDLEGFNIGNMAHYSKCIDMLQKLSNQSQKMPVEEKERLSTITSKEIIDIANEPLEKRPEDVLKELLANEGK